MQFLKTFCIFAKMNHYIRTYENDIYDKVISKLKMLRPTSKVNKSQLNAIY
ncbi:hypothetical protein LEP1GSC059_1511 [Leptospira noguchii serovar Panama str. CZ214]|uniref:Uncharacterized protein n=1 Tax=Leptospira noguchii serovar Panama str. CZ214 TaxID=1001595 RepID=T0H0I5_9LEPT|nr:hypothetical protein LEP1GSC059_1511 [Leptospira noguchii serovar Panama str. CZ214]